MRPLRVCCAVLAICVFAGAAASQDSPREFRRIQYNNPGLVVDLGVGLWAQPLPMDFDEDGDLDMAAATADVPYNGIYVFENPGGPDPIFPPGRRVGRARHDIVPSYVGGQAQVLTPGKHHADFRASGIDAAEDILLEWTPPFERTRALQWKFVDFNGDGKTDISIGVGVWDDYGWDNAYDAHGNWTNGPLHGYVYIALNDGSEAQPHYLEPSALQAATGPVDVFGAPSPNFEDWDGDGDLDLICGSFLDTLTYFQNIGTRTEPRYADGLTLQHEGADLRMELEMLQVVAIDWDRDGDADLVVGEEDGRISWLECTGKVNDGLPEFLPPRYFRQQAADVKVGALATPYSVDWDSDGDEDLIVGDTAGFLNFVENLDGGNPPRWAAPVRLKAVGETIRIQAGVNRSIQGPAEAKWGYTVPNVADWNHDGLLDIVINSIWGEVLWYENTGTRTNPQLAAAQHVRVAWKGEPPKPAWIWWTPKLDGLLTQWRTSPIVRDIDGDGLNDLAMLDHEGYLAFFRRHETSDGLMLAPGERIFLGEDRQPLQLNAGIAGKSGRRKLAMTDWDADGDIDLLANGMNIDLYRNIAEKPGEFIFKNEGPLGETKLAGHDTCPTVVDWDRNGMPDLLAGAEDGHLYYLPHP